MINKMTGVKKVKMQKCRNSYDKHEKCGRGDESRGILYIYHAC